MNKIFQFNKEDFISGLKKRGVNDDAVLKAMSIVPRENFVGIKLQEFAYEDSPLPIEEGQTISQPYMVALMTQSLWLKPTDRVLEIGTGSGYAAAVLSRIVDQVYTIERHQALAHQAEERLQALHYDNVKVLCGDGTLGWPELAPFDAIVVTASGPEAPRTLIEQLNIGGRLVIPVGESVEQQHLLRIIRQSEEKLKIDELGAVRFVPLIGEEGWDEFEQTLQAKPKIQPAKKQESLSELIREAAIHLPSIDSVDLTDLLDRVGDARIVLLGEASHGTAEFYEMRARISKELIEHKGFNFVAAEADWPDAAQMDHFVRDTRSTATEEITFSRFPTWMWANSQVLEFLQWLRHYNAKLSSPENAIGFFGLDLYSLYSSIDAIINYLEQVDQKTAEIARQRYGCLTPWQTDPAAYGAAAFTGSHQSCEQEVVEMLDTMMAKRLNYSLEDGRRYLDAVSNARLVKNAEHYYRIMYQGGAKSWNFRDQHMFDTMKSLLKYHGPDSKVIVWAHNSHIGDAVATQMSARGETNLGHLCRQEFKDKVYSIGFGTHQGTVAAASDWGAPMEIKQVRPSHPDSYERLCHDSGLDAFMLPLKDKQQSVVKELVTPRLERAIGVIYRPETEIQSHYFDASLPYQFDEYIWFDETRAVDTLGLEAGVGVPDTFPFGL